MTSSANVLLQWQGNSWSFSLLNLKLKMTQHFKKPCRTPMRLKEPFCNKKCLKR